MYGHKTITSDRCENLFAELQWLIDVLSTLNPTLHNQLGSLLSFVTVCCAL